MTHPMLRPMRIRQFLLCWFGSSILLWPLVVIPTLIIIVLLDPQFSTVDLTVTRLSYIYGSVAWWQGSYINDVFVAVFSIAMGFAQAWMFAYWLDVRIRFWRILTMLGGCIGALLMGVLELPFPFSMTPWFALLALGQWWTIRKSVKYSYLWFIAHIAVSLFFPTFFGNIFLTIAHWMLATGIYAAATIFVLYQLAQNARIDKMKAG